MAKLRIFLCVFLLGFAQAAAAQQVPQTRAEMTLSFVPLVKQATPAVVSIYAKVVRQARRSPFSSDPFFERFFRDFDDARPQIQNSLGSGVILSPDGIVVSNYHVVGNATDIRVVLSDRREFSADVLLADEASDLVVLRLRETDGLPYLPLRVSETVEVGELVLAIGNPFGVGQTVSSGIVSGLARSGAARGRGYLIQTDAPINPGNSGGALVDVNGALLGINTSILTRSGGSNGIGFAIPADLVAAIVAQAKAGYEQFVRPWAGLRAQAMEADMTEAFGVEVPQGIIVSGLHPASPFAKAGLQTGDVVVRLDGQLVSSLAELEYRMIVSGPGAVATVEWLRSGALRQGSIDLSAAPDLPPREEMVLEADALLSGAWIMRVNPSVIEEYDLPLEARGVLVADPARMGLRAGLRRGDVIESINGVAVSRPSDVWRELSGGASRFSVAVLRNNRRVLVQFRV